MIGVYDYTVILTYLSLVSAVSGIFVALHGNGHPYIGIFFLMFCGLCDAFDGKVARTKKNRTELEKGYGVQIDSLSDLVAFGVLPACIGDSMLCIYPKIPDIPHLITQREFDSYLSLAVLATMILYVLAAMIRLAYFNVTEEQRTDAIKNGKNVYFDGLPVTSACLIFPVVMLLQYTFSYDLTPVYFIVMFITAVLFVSKIKIKKPGTRGVMILVGIGLIEALILLFVSGGLRIH